MTTTLNDYRAKFINKVLFAISQEEVKRFCKAVIDDLESQHLHGHLIVRFLEKTVNELGAFNPMNQDSQQWSNIITAKVLCNRLIQNFSYSHE